MRDHREEFPIGKMAKVLKVSRSGYYRWLQGHLGKRALEKEVLRKEIRILFVKHKGRYGSPRIREDLKEMGYCCSRIRVSKIMKEED